MKLSKTLLGLFVVCMLMMVSQPTYANMGAKGTPLQKETKASKKLTFKQKMYKRYLEKRIKKMQKRAKSIQKTLAGNSDLIRLILIIILALLLISLLRTVLGSVLWGILTLVVTIVVIAYLLKYLGVI
ncbi:MAG: hypothetical protein ACPGXZ_13550 [Saprospiraceae bacterium]